MYIVTAFAVTMFFSCKDNLNEVRNIGVSDNEPIGVADTINSVYTDSAKVKDVLVSPKMLNYTNRDFPFYEFPNGVNLEIYDDENNKTTVVSDYAISYTNTDLIDLQGHVVIATHTNDTLFADQLYYDQKKEWVFTNKPVIFKKGTDRIEGTGFDSNSDFTNTEVLEISGIITVEE